MTSSWRRWKRGSAGACPARRIDAIFQSNAELVEATAKRRSSLQGAYMNMPARALGLDLSVRASVRPAAGCTGHLVHRPQHAHPVRPEKTPKKQRGQAERNDVEGRRVVPRYASLDALPPPLPR